jgi:hypothetical protein
VAGREYREHEWFRIAIIDSEVITDGALQLDGTAVSSAADFALGQHGEPAAREAHSDVREVKFAPLLDVLRFDPRYPALLAEWKLAD